MLALVDARHQEGPARLERPPSPPHSDVVSEVADIVADVRLRGDAALLEHTAQFHGARFSAERLRVEAAAIAAARDLVPRELITALEAMATACRETGGRTLPATWLEGDKAQVTGELVRPLRRAGIYVDGPVGNPAAVITGVVAAQVAGVLGIAVSSPPGAAGEVAEATLAACAITGVDEVYRIGGAHAIAAMAYGTETVRPVESVFGAGGRYVTTAQRLVRGWVGTGPECWPSELVIIADETSTPRVVAADLIANAARGPGGTHAVLTTDEGLLEEVVAALDAQVPSLSGGEDVENALIEGGRAILVRNLDHALETVNAFVPQHLVLAIARPQDALERVRKAGSVVLGDAAPVSVLPYLTGGAGGVPTGGTARWDSALSPRDFVTTIPVSGTDETAVQGSAAALVALSRAEGSTADQVALSLRLGR